eukprot:GDKJ01024029.1.p1 GENE.GDKJ01024029.1~~GDKJ01024029.1.p1  ORF type:complete len:626 (-),score=123.28 GDKJ01024029.1:403-2280(-)
MQTWQKAIAVIIFVLVWLGMIREEYKFVKLGRTVATLTGAAAMMMFQIMNQHDGYSSISLDTLALLTGCMFISAYADDAGCFKVLQRTLEGFGVPKPPTDDSQDEAVRYKTEFEAYEQSVASRFFSPELVFLMKMGVISSVLGALMTNDTACVLLAPVVARAAYIRGFHPAPYLIGLGTTANIGASLTPVGSPQAMIIGGMSGISFGNFLATQILAGIACWFINIFVIVAFFSSEFFPAMRQRVYGQPLIRPLRKDPYALNEAKAVAPQTGATVVSPIEQPSDAALEEEKGEKDSPPPPFVPEEPSVEVSIEKDHSDDNDDDDDDKNPTESNEEKAAINEEDSDRMNQSRRSHSSHSPSSYETIRRRLSRTIPSMHTLVNPRVSTDSTVVSGTKDEVLGDAHKEDASPRPIEGWRSIMIHLLLIGFPFALAFYETPGMGWVSIAVACLMAIVDGTSPLCRLVRVDGTLLLFFAALFVVMAGLNKTEWPKELWQSMEGSINVNSGSGVTLYALFIIVFSNIISNVPLCIMLGPLIKHSLSFVTPPEKIGVEDRVARAWMILQFVSTVGGNLTLVGSVANLIVVKCAAPYYHVGFLEFTKVAFLSTVIGCVVGTLLVYVSCIFFVNF